MATLTSARVVVAAKAQRVGGMAAKCSVARVGGLKAKAPASARMGAFTATHHTPNEQRTQLCSQL